MALVLLWLRDNQPDAINNPALREKLFTFDVGCYFGATMSVISARNLQLTERALLSALTAVCRGVEASSRNPMNLKKCGR